MIAPADRSGGPNSRSAWAATSLVRLYPRLWRERYGGELVDLLQSRRLTIAVVLATASGAFDAQVNLPDLMPGWFCGSARLRWSVTTTLAAWAAFCLAAAGVAKSTEAPALADATRAFSAAGGAWFVASTAFAVAALASACGGLSLAIAAIRQAYRRRDGGAFGLLSVPVAAAAAVVGSGVLLGRLQHGSVQSVGTVAVSVGWLALVVVAAVAAVGSAAALVRRTDVSQRLLRYAGWAAVVASAAMSGGLIAGVGYGLVVEISSPHLFTSANGVLGTPLPVTWAVALALAGASVLVADRAALQALRGLRSAA